jgi:pimeloyl-ACP methyl ester carboxylesterase
VLDNRLLCIEMGEASGAPILLLHGFGGWADSWSELQKRLSRHKRTLAFDLPGHGGSIGFPEVGEPKIAARAIIAELEKRNIKKAHLVGFSMGGAVASLIGLFSPNIVVSLTLLAPGGFGPEINHRILQAFARADDEQTLRMVVPQFFGFFAEISDSFINSVVASRRLPGATESLIRIADLLFDGSKQGVIPIKPLVEIGVPIKVLWGTQDNILPTRQAHKLPGLIATHVFPDTGHMLIQEQPEAVYRLIMENTSHV